MDSSPTSQIIASAADLRGIEREYWDNFGRLHEASDALILAILRSMGIDASSASSLEDSIRARRPSPRPGALPPVVVLSKSDLHLPVALPAAHPAMEAAISVVCEDGSARASTISLDTLPAQGESKLVPLGDLPLGYHTLDFSSGAVHSACRLIVTPDRAYSPDTHRLGGVAVSLYSLRSDRNWGCGDFSDLEVFSTWAARLGAAFVSLNPLHSIANRAPYNASPYLPNSIFFRNFLYLDVERLPEFLRSPRARRILASPHVQTEIAALRASENVEYERVARLKLRFLKLLFRVFPSLDPSEHAAFERYRAAQGEPLARFALHATLDDALHRANPGAWNWSAWAAAYRDPDSAEVREFSSRHPKGILFYQWIQWRIDEQLERAQRHALAEGMTIGLYHDLALAVDRYGADTWSNPSFFVKGCRVGAPPDDFSPNGQDWAFPPPNSERHWLDGYRLFAESVRRNMRHGGALRIDHVMRFFRLYWIPDGMNASQGTYVRDRYEDLIRILALESVRNRVLVVGEDLGTVPPIARETLARFGILSYRLLYFEKDYGRDPPRLRRAAEYPVDALVSVSTHDLPTLAGFWLNHDIEARRAAGILPDGDAYNSALRGRMSEKQKLLDLLREEHLLPPGFSSTAASLPDFAGELHSAITGFLASTPSRLFLLNQEDIFKDTEQQNLPGTTAEYPNWRHKMKYKLEEFGAGFPEACASMFHHWLIRSGRASSGEPR